MTTAAATRQGEKRQEEAAEESDDLSTNMPEHSQTSVDDCSDEDSYGASIPGGDDVEMDERLTRAAMPGENGRRIIFIEFCTNPDSRIGRLAPPGVEVIRLTIGDDLTTPAGLDKAMNASPRPMPLSLYLALYLARVGANGRD